MKISLSAPINDTGYGIASLNIIRELANLDYDISYFALGQPSVHNSQDYDLIKKILHNQDNFDVYAPYLKIWHQFDLAQRIGRGKYCAFPFFELDIFNKREKLHLSVPDEIIVCSDWAKRIVIENGIKNPVNVVPLGVNRLIFNDMVKKQRNDDKYVFINIGKWEIRKGHDILIDIFHRAFPDNNNVELWILAPEHNNSYSNEEELERWHKKYSGDRIKLFNGLPTHEDVARLIAEADCGIFPSRAEGWNLELLETMSMGKPVITTNYSAHTEFCNQDNAYLVDIASVEPAYDGKAFYKQGNWAKISGPEIDKFTEYMKYVVKNNIRNNPNGIITAKQYSWKNSATILSGCIK